MQNIFDQCLDIDYLINPCEQELTCSICLQFMVTPHYLQCGHVFGFDCIKQWKKQSCPMCRNTFSSLKIHAKLKQRVDKYEAKCKMCGLNLMASQMMYHLSICPKNQPKWIIALRAVIQLQNNTLDLEINPHIKAVHGEIYEIYRRDWEWMAYDDQQWRELWNSNPWWNNKACKKCNSLWNVYQHQINELQSRRLALVASQHLHGEEY